MAIDVDAAANKAKKVTVDGQAVERHALKDLIEAEQNASGNTAAKSKRRGLIINKLRPPGSV